MNSLTNVMLLLAGSAAANSLSMLDNASNSESSNTAEGTVVLKSDTQELQPKPSSSNQESNQLKTISQKADEIPKLAYLDHFGVSLVLSLIGGSLTALLWDPKFWWFGFIAGFYLSQVSWKPEDFYNKFANRKSVENTQLSFKNWAKMLKVKLYVVVISAYAFAVMHLYHIFQLQGLSWISAIASAFLFVPLVFICRDYRKNRQTWNAKTKIGMPGWSQLEFFDWVSTGVEFEFQEQKQKPLQNSSELRTQLMHMKFTFPTLIVQWCLFSLVYTILAYVIERNPPAADDQEELA